MKYLACTLTSLAAAATLAAQTTPVVNFTTGQAARLVIGQPTFTAQDNNSTALILGGVGGIAYANNTLFVTDANRLQATPVNHRVLIYQNLNTKFPAPTDELFQTTRCPVCIGAADVILGQPDPTKIGSNNLQSPSSSSMRAPQGIASDGNVLVVADTDFNRVLIWNTVPQYSNTPADVVLGQADFTKTVPNEGKQNVPTNRAFRGPQGVWVQNGKLFVADTGNNRVLIWNSVPRSNFQPADVVIGQKDFTSVTQPDLTKTTIDARADNMLTPVSVTSDGRRMVVADLGHNRVLVWNSIPATNSVPADLVLGQPDFTTADANNTKALCPTGETDANGNEVILPLCESSMNFPRFALSDGRYLFVADGGNDRVLVYSEFPTQNGTKADAILGQIGERVNLISDGFDPRGISSSGAVRTPQALAFDGRNLYVTDPFNRRVMVFTLAERKVQNNGVRNAASKEIFAVGSITFAGEVKENQEPTVKIGDKEYKYKTVKDETFDSLITAIVTLINAAPGDPLVLATPNYVRGSIIFTARKAGEEGNAVTFSITQTATDSTLTTTTSGATLLGGQDAALIAPGTIVSLFGDNLSEVTASADPNAQVLPDEIAGVQVYFDGIRAPLFMVSPTEVRAQVPWEVLDTQSINAWVRTKKSNGQISVSSAVSVPIVLQNPGIFAVQDAPEPRPAMAFHGSPASVGTISVDGSIHAGDIATVVIEDREYSYTVIESDTLVSVRDKLIALINEDPRVEAYAASAFARIRLRSRVPGPDGNNITYSARSRDGDQVIMTATTGRLCCANSGPITEENPAVPGENIILYATGLGLVKDGNKEYQNTGRAYDGPALNDPSEFVSSLAGGKTANVLSAGMKPGSVGIFEVVLELNSDLPTDPATQVTIAQDVFVSNIVTFPLYNPNPTAP
jgi:hypothetical protein